MLNKVKNFFTLAFLFSLWCFMAPSVFAQPDPPPPPPPPTLTAEQVAAIVKENETLKAAAEAAKKKETEPDPKEGDDLQAKAKAFREAKEKQDREAKVVENAIGFNMSADEFVKKNSDLLPKDFGEILKAAAKETYDTAILKASAIKASMIQSFFGVQANVDSLTPSQKADLDEFLRMTKTAKEEKATSIYANLFEPTLEALRRVKKAEELGRSRAGLATGTDLENSYKDRLIQGSRKAHLGEKQA